MRVRKLVRYLPDFGWDPVIVTSREVDESFAPEEEIAKAVYRARSPDPRRLYRRARSRIRSCLGNGNAPGNPPDAAAGSKAGRWLVPDHLLGWIPFGIIAGLKAAREHHVDVIWSTSPLPSSLLVALVVKRITGIPWVVDLRDPWTTNTFSTRRGLASLDTLDRLLERSVLTNADRIITVSEGYIDPIRSRHPAVSREKFLTIPNGFDQNDFDGIDAWKFAEPTLLHAGSLYGPRTAVLLVRALAKVLRTDPARRFSICFVGVIDPATMAEISELGVQDRVKFVPAVSHRESIAAMAGADWLLLIPGPGRGTIPGKLFEYLASGRPILNLSGPGFASDLIEQHGLGEVIEPDDLDALVKFLEMLSETKRIPDRKQVPPALAARFSRREIARKVAMVLDSVRQPLGSGNGNA